MRDKVLKALEKVKTMLSADGGSAELVDVTSDGIVKIRLTGACGGMPDEFNDPEDGCGADNQAGSSGSKERGGGLAYS